jgi:hypothetical protein
MNYVVIATILSTVSSAKLALGVACTKFDECVDDASCSAVTKKVNGDITSMCITTTDCNDDTKEPLGSDDNKYAPNK